MDNSIDQFYEQQLARAMDRRLGVYAVLLDGDGVVRRANAYARKVSGEDILGKAFADLVVEFQRGFVVDDFAASDDTDQLLSLSSAEGMPRSFHCSLSRHAGHTLLIAEESLEDLDQLRKTLIETNGELSYLTRRYQKANVQLTKLNEQKNHFLGIAAHDLRNPLAAILAYCDFLLEDMDPEDEERVSFLENIKISSRYMLDLLEDLLDVTQIEAGKLSLDMQEARLIDLVRKNIELNSIIAQRKDISIRLCCHEDLPPVPLDPMKIEQVLNNIISNAVKYSHSGTAVEVSIFRSGDYATLSVKDQGIGIPAKDIDRIFQPFAKLGRQGTAGESSTGLGLAIVQKIILGHKGRIWVESTEGEGTTFYFTLPLPDKG